MYDLCIKNGTVVDNERSYKADIYIKDGIIKAIVSPTETYEAAECIDAGGKYVFPGFVDPHTHLNDPPGGDVSEDFWTGTCSAAAGGVTTVMEMPLTTPVVDSAERFVSKRNICGAKALVDYAMFGACSPNNLDETDKMTEEGAVAFKAFTCYSTEITRLNDASLIDVMERFAGNGHLLSLHCENADIIADNTKKLREEGKTKPMDYIKAHTELSEIEAVQRAALFALHTGAKVHVCHCSLAEAVEIVDEYKRLGANITVETCPHYLTLDETDIEKWGPYCICNPPLRSKERQDELWQSILDGKVDFLGTDHSAYLHTEKAEGKDNVFDTPPGITAMQLCFPLFFDEAVNKRGLPVEKFVDMSSTAAAKRYDIYPEKGALNIGSDADIVIFDPDEKWIIKNEDLFYLEKWTPNVGSEVTGRVKKTLVRGKVVFDNGEIVGEAGYGKFVPKKNIR